MSSPHTDRAHSEIGASSAYRWTKCPGSVKLLQQHPMPTSDVAAEGTKAHELSELLLLDKVVEFNDYDQDMLHTCRDYVDWIRTLMGAIEKTHNTWPDLIVEKRFAMKSISTDNLKAFGTNDVCLSVDFGPLHIIDLKYGHKFVNVVGNEQLMYYALGIIEELDLNPTEVHLWVYGPRMPWDAAGYNSPAMHWDCPMDRLLEYHQELKNGAKQVEENPDKFNPGDEQCFYCNKGECPALQGALAKTFADIEPAGDQLVNQLNVLDTAELAERLKWRDMFEGAFRDIAVILKHRAEQGEEVPGHKLVRATGNRAFKADVSTSQLVSLGLKKADLFEEPKRKSPAKVEKLIKDKMPGRKKDDKEKRDKVLSKFNALVERPDRGLKLVGVDQPGEPVAPKLEFDDIEGITGEHEEDFVFE